MRESVERLDKAIGRLMNATMKNKYNIGALRGVMVSDNSVRIDDKVYAAVPATDVNTVPGEYVWCQLADGNTAVIVGA